MLKDTRLLGQKQSSSLLMVKRSWESLMLTSCWFPCPWSHGDDSGPLMDEACTQGAAMKGKQPKPVEFITLIVSHNKPFLWKGGYINSSLKVADTALQNRLGKEQSGPFLWAYPARMCGAIHAHGRLPIPTLGTLHGGICYFCLYSGLECQPETQMLVND